MELKDQYKNKEVLEHFQYSLLSSVLNKIEIVGLNGEAVVRLSFTLTNGSKIRLELVDVIEYNFYHSSDYNFYNVASYKFFMTDNGSYYISLDPFSEKEIVEQEDNDFIVAKEIILYKG